MTPLYLQNPLTIIYGSIIYIAMHMPDFIPVSSALHKTSVTHDFTTLGVIISFHHHLLLWYTCYLITGTVVLIFFN